MNLEEIMKLEGQDLTDAVAIHVMKWNKQVLPNGIDSEYTAPYWVKSYLDNIPDSKIYDNRWKYIEPYNIWHPHWDLKDAWGVVMHLKLKGFHSSHTDLSIDSYYERWSWSFSQPYGFLYSAQSTRVEEAICKAALVLTFTHI